MSVQIYKVKVFNNGRKEWRLNDKLHRDDGPAIETEDGSKYWYQNGKFHRLDGPAYIESDGSKYWYQNNLLHREDGPAVEWSDGTNEWWIEGKRVLEPKPEPVVPTCNGRIVEIDGKKYQLKEI